MSFEETLSSIDTTLKNILAALHSGTQMAAAVAGEPEKSKTKAATKSTDKAGKPTSDAAGAVLEGHEPGTQYWMSKDERDFYVTKPGEAKPPVDNINNVSAAYYSAKKNVADTEAKKSSAAAAAGSTAGTAPSATAQPDTASGAVTFKQVVDALQTLSKGTVDGQGRAGVMGFLTKHLSALPEAERKVPKLEALGKNDVLLAEVNDLLNPPAVVAEDDDPFAS